MYDCTVACFLVLLWAAFWATMGVTFINLTINLTDLRSRTAKIQRVQLFN
ncbi:hypothetical protein CDPW8_0812 [Corynebacterium diphtheriae PW8]|nr:hypothetical protein CDPW8_0812 [Corynebacterium diphtheriae PW8]